MMFRTEIRNGEYSWICFKCHQEYPNTLLFCPHCHIARKHSHNLYETKKIKKQRKKKK